MTPVGREGHHPVYGFGFEGLHYLKCIPDIEFCPRHRLLENGGGGARIYRMGLRNVPEAAIIQPAYLNMLGI